MNRKVSELPEAQQISDDDVIMVLQSNENKKAAIDKLFPLKQTSVTLDSKVNVNTNYTVPFYYKVRQQQFRGFLLQYKIREAE